MKPTIASDRSAESQDVNGLLVRCLASEQGLSAIRFKVWSL
ncbi:MAG: hypothetical protein AAGM36_03820 [Cyanobacteria bacterium J06597_1]